MISVTGLTYELICVHFLLGAEQAFCRQPVIATTGPIELLDDAIASGKVEPAIKSASGTRSFKIRHRDNRLG
jgi:hypothetical protein